MKGRTSELRIGKRPPTWAPRNRYRLLRDRDSITFAEVRDAHVESRIYDPSFHPRRGNPCPEDVDYLNDLVSSDTFRT